uniref:SbsA Ig-like domain-containing protein n=1 Tax=Cyanothece sp. (strain PCC 7425 / ATCC 29141) TaxID=395961 RepID=B8HXJ2_CYAP4
MHQSFFSRLQPLDRTALSLILILAVLTALLLGTGDHTLPKVRDFSWQHKQVGAEDTAFMLTFNRLMDWQSVTSNLHLNPPLPGRTSWRGRRLAYTLNQPIPYGQAFQLKLEGAQEATLSDQVQPKLMQPFTGQFRSRDRAFVYLGTGKEDGRLVLQNLTLGKQTILTPPHLVVLDFKPYPQGDRILFSAVERRKNGQPAFDPQLYTVSTGIAIDSSRDSSQAEPVGKLERVLDNREYQILKFDLSADGEKIVVQRASRKDVGQTGLWLIQAGADPQLLPVQAGGDFLIAPDSSTLVMAQGKGLAILPLDPDASSQLLDFLPQFGMVLGFTPDGSAATMVRFNSDFTRSLYLVNNQGSQTELLRTNGSILSTQFDPQKRTLYCLLTRLLPGRDYNEQPFIAAIDLQTRQISPLLDLPGQRDLQMSLAADGSGLLFDQLVNKSAQSVPLLTSHLWLLPITPATATQPAEVLAPQPLNPGSHARWLP